MRVVAVASEIYPLVKTGGLADVVGALPDAVRAHGIEMRTLVPGYPAVMEGAQGEVLRRFDDLFGGPATVVAAGDLYMLDAPHLYTRPGNPYLGPDGKDWPDNWRRFAALAFVGAELGREADVVHAHDWQAALAAVYLKRRTLLTIHNLAFQGNFPASIFPELRLPPEAFGIGGLEFYGGANFLKGGLQYAEAISTVSPTYAEEICTPEGGMGLDGVLRERRGRLTGIVNGIDERIWDPENDPALEARYSARTLDRRTQNRRAIEARFELEQAEGPLFCVVSRLTGQKGMDILADCLDELVAAGGRLALLGSGDAALEDAFTAAAKTHKGRIGAVFGYDEALAHLLQGGADAILIPSRFEPCGLTQLYGLRYGCVPVVSRVGGLADTIIDANDAALDAGVASGFQFAPAAKEPLLGAIRRVAALFRDRKRWRAMQRRGMKADVSWEKSAARYAQLYRKLAS